MSRRRPFWTVDCETDPFKIGRVPEPFVWGAYTGENESGVEEYYELNNAEEVVTFFRDKKVIVYAHNGGKFDYHYLREFINSDEPIMVIAGRLARFRIGDCEFRDSLNIFPNTRLADFGGKIEIDYALMESERRSDPNVRAQISLYLRQDCKLLWEMVARYRKDYGISLTQAGASMRYWEKNYHVKAPRQTKAQHDRYRPFFYGGRVQCFESGVSDCSFSVADINSAYPFAMLRAHPFCPEAEIRDHLPPDEKIGRCLVKLDAISRGALPWRDPTSGELYFPDDEAGNRNRVRCYTVTGWELLAGLELDAIRITNIREVHYFPQTVDFKDYIEYFFNKREEARLRGDVAGRIFGKYFMNSLYGKFGANPENYGEYVIASDDSFTQWTLKGYSYYKPWGERYLMERRPTEEDLQDGQGKWRFYNIATAASITGCVRAQLFRALSACSGLIYCDTDSIVARDTGRLSFGSVLGAWKHEGTFDRYAIAGKKLYAFHHAGADEEYDPKWEEKKPKPPHGNWKVASKGVNFGAQKEGPDRIMAIARGGTVVHSPEVPCYTLTRETPRFIPREIKHTAKDMSIAPESAVA